MMLTTFLKNNIRLLSILTFLVTTNSACKSSEQDTIADAQQCLDSATPSTVDVCIAKVAGLNSPQAQAIRCYGAFTKEGFSKSSKLVSAMDAIKGGINSGNYATFLGLISFTSQGTTGFANASSNYDLAKSASSTCAGSNIKSGTLISTFAFLANAFYKAGCDASSAVNCDPTCNTGNGVCIVSGAATILLNAGGAQNALLADLGTVVANTWNVACASGEKTDEMCTLINSAVHDGGGVGNPTAIGQKFVENIQQ